MKEIKLPQWGMSMMEGTITDWLVQPGDTVTVGQTVAEVESSKTTNTVEAMHADTIGKLLVEVGATVPVNTVLATILEEGEWADDQPAVVPPEEAKAAEAPQAAPRERGPGVNVQAVPLARRLAKENGIDLTTVTGTGPRGRVMVADIEAAIETADSGNAPAGAGEKMSRMRKIIGERMVESLRHSAQLTLVTTADVTEFAELRASGDGAKPTYADAVIRAVALALKDHPGVNSRIDGEGIVALDDVNVGMAVALDEGLVVPVIRNADGLTLAELAPITADLAGKARKGALGPDDFDGGTFTVTSLGGQGIDAFTPVLNLPEPAILGVGRSREVAVRDGDEVAWRRHMTLSLTIDHRLIDGYPGALFLADVVGHLEQPGEL